MTRRPRALLLACLALPLALGAAATTLVRADDDDAAARRKAGKAALAGFGDWVGDWKGIGMPKRGSAKGAWRELVAWAWAFDGGAALRFTSPDGKYYVEGRVEATETDGSFRLVAKRPDGSEETFEGTLAEGKKLVLDATGEVGDGRPARVTIDLVAKGDRMLMLYESKRATGTFKRIAELGLTRKGSGFGKAGSGGPECIITGGLGTISVTHDGKTYLVCCSGCKDLFEADPEGELAAYRERKQEEAAEKKAALEKEKMGGGE